MIHRLIGFDLKLASHWSQRIAVVELANLDSPHENPGRDSKLVYYGDGSREQLRAVL